VEAGKKARGFGLIIIGNEILDGRIRDRHFETTQRLLTERSLELVYAQVLPDDPDVIDAQLRWAMERPEPFFSCGGIGSTPDDHTRGCAGRVAGLPLELHPEGVALLKARFGDDATPARLKMVEFPKGATLIPNPVNQVPGFRVRNGHFLPGFPRMAEPMMAWVMDTWYERGEDKVARKLVLPGCREADLVDVMKRFIDAHPSLRFSSLPRFTDTGTEVHLGLSGNAADVEVGMADLVRDLERAGVELHGGEGQ
jgi:molybdopterin-biosynthesis enzyme MoeA-like protein